MRLNTNISQDVTRTILLGVTAERSDSRFTKRDHRKPEDRVANSGGEKADTVVDDGQDQATELRRNQVEGLALVLCF